jgi:endonuclease/exonuclease/phosphatase family metal-dependent hydrolase
LGILNFIKKFFFLINVLFSLYSLLVFQLVYTANIKHWLGGFLMLSYPLVIVGHLIFLLIYVFLWSTKAFLSLSILLISLPIFNRTLKLSPSEVSGRSDFSFSLLSYNLMYGDYKGFVSGKDTKTGKSQSNVLDTLTADIRCFQELYNSDEFKEFDLLKKLSKRNEYYVYMHSNPGNDKGKGPIGLAIFSRFPILNKNEIYWPPNNNGLLSADIVINKDTIRVINFQLKSMGIRVKKILNNNRSIDPEETRNVLRKLKSGFEKRAVQVNVLEKWIFESPYPVVLTGDLNELPYGYAYGRLRKTLANSFEESGFGFGFTYRRIPRFLRIDNQFFDKEKFDCIEFQTFSEIPFSDHYPIKGWYMINN